MKLGFVTFLFCLTVTGSWATFPLPYFHIGFAPPQPNYINQNPLARIMSPFFDFPQTRRHFMVLPQPPSFFYPTRYNNYEYPQQPRFPPYPEYYPRPQNNLPGNLVQYIYQQTAVNPAANSAVEPIKNVQPIVQEIFKPQTIAVENPDNVQTLNSPMNLGFLSHPMENMPNILTQNAQNPSLVPMDDLGNVVDIYNRLGDVVMSQKIIPVETITNTMNSASVTKTESTTNPMDSASVTIIDLSTTNPMDSASVTKTEVSTTNEMDSASVIKPEESTTNPVNSESEIKSEESTISIISSTELKPKVVAIKMVPEAESTKQPPKTNNEEATEVSTMRSTEDIELGTTNLQEIIPTV